jgi:hypothetical protein
MATDEPAERLRREAPAVVSERRKSLETVKSQRKSILLKLGARNMTQAVAIAVRAQILINESAA